MQIKNPRWICCLFVTFAFVSFIHADEPSRLRILTYNIHHGEGVDGKLDLERISQVITSVAPDLVSVQEVDRGTKRTGGVDQPAELARLTGLRAVFEQNLAFEGGDYGNVVLSRFPVASHHNLRLPQLTPGEPRGALTVDVNVPGLMEPLAFIATHLDHRPHPADRIASARFLNEHLAKLGESPAILAGDLNAVPDSEPMRIFREHWTDTATKPLPTIPVEKPSRQIDYILVRPASRWRTVEVRVLDEAVASDHRALLAVLELLP